MTTTRYYLITAEGAVELWEFWAVQGGTVGTRLDDPSISIHEPCPTWLDLVECLTLGGPEWGDADPGDHKVLLPAP